ncbi:MAG TPA: DUF4381 domain-containing protein [Rugosibacter sp.]
MGGVTPKVESAWLAQLAPAHAPPSPGWLPLAPGWWGILIVLVVTLALLAYWQTRPSVQLRRVALRELEKIAASDSDTTVLAQSLEHLLRRYAVAQFGRDAVANLSGERWIAFVIAHGGTGFSGTAGSDLLRVAYGGDISSNNVDRTLWLNGARTFIKRRKQ